MRRPLLKAQPWPWLGHRLISPFPAPLRLFPLAVGPFCRGQIDFCSRQILGIRQKRGGGQSEYAAEEMSKCRQNWEGPAVVVVVGQNRQRRLRNTFTLKSSWVRVVRKDWSLVKTSLNCCSSNFKFFREIICGLCSCHKESLSWIGFLPTGAWSGTSTQLKLSLNELNSCPQISAFQKYNLGRIVSLPW